MRFCVDLCRDADVCTSIISFAPLYAEKYPSSDTFALPYSVLNVPYEGQFDMPRLCPIMSAGFVRWKRVSPDRRLKTWYRMTAANRFGSWWSPPHALEKQTENIDEKYPHRNSPLYVVEKTEDTKGYEKRGRKRYKREARSSSAATSSTT